MSTIEISLTIMTMTEPTEYMWPRPDGWSSRRANTLRQHLTQSTSFARIKNTDILEDTLKNLKQQIPLLVSLPSRSQELQTMTCKKILVLFMHNMMFDIVICQPGLKQETIHEGRIHLFESHRCTLPLICATLCKVAILWIEMSSFQ